MKFPLATLAGASALSFAGCASPSHSLPGRPLAETHVNLRYSGRIGVVAFSSAPSVTLMMPANKSEAFQAATANIRALTESELGTLRDLTFLEPAVGSAMVLTMPVLFPAISGLAGTIDAVQSAVRAESEQRLAPSRETLQAAVAAVRLENLVRDRVLATLRGETIQPPVVISATTLRTIDPTLAQRAWRSDSGLSAKARHALAQRGLDRVLEIKVHAPALVAPSPIDPQLALNAQVSMRLVSLPDGAELYRRDAKYFGEPRHHTEWAANDTALLRAELERCIEMTAQTGTQGLVRHGTPANPVRQLAAITP